MRIKLANCNFYLHLMCPYKRYKISKQKSAAFFKILHCANSPKTQAKGPLTSPLQGLELKGPQYPEHYSLHKITALSFDQLKLSLSNPYFHKVTIHPARWRAGHPASKKQLHNSAQTKQNKLKLSPQALKQNKAHLHQYQEQNPKSGTSSILLISRTGLNIKQSSRWP